MATRYRRSLKHFVALLFLATATAAAGSDTTHIILLGTGMPAPDPTAFGPSTAIVVGERIFVVDAGPGVMRRLTAAGLPQNRVTALFLTHLHSDHTLGYPDLVLTTWVMGRRTPFDVFGPEGTESMTQNIFEAWKEDIRIRVEGLERNSEGGYRVNVHEYDPGVLYDSAGVRVTAFRVPHGSWKEAYGFRFDTPDRSIVISGDTGPSDSVIAWSKGVDVLIHEVYPSVKLKPEDRPGGELWPEYMHTFHTSDEELGRIARAAGPRQLILYHIVRMGGTDDEVIEGVRRGGYTGPAVVGKDLQTF